MSYTMTFDMPQKTAAYVERRGPRYRAELNAIFVAIVTSSMKNEEEMAGEPQPLSADDPRIEAAVSGRFSRFTVRRGCAVRRFN